jgi:multiple sugar transport system permease protein
MTMIFDPSNGPVNLLLTKLGIIKGNIFFLGNATTALGTSAVIWIWKWTGTSLIYWLASLQSIPHELYEAAVIDGAGAWQKFRFITAPLLIPFGAIILILTIGDAMRVFDLMLTLTGGGPFYRTEVMELFIYRQAFASSVPRIGYASAAAMIFGLIFIVLTLIQQSVGFIKGRKGS